MNAQPKEENPFAISKGISGLIWHVVRKSDYVVVGTFESQLKAYDYRRILIKYSSKL